MKRKSNIISPSRKKSISKKSNSTHSNERPNTPDNHKNH